MEERHLAAIMFTDIVGYTSLMDRDEPRALQLVRKYRKIQKNLIEKYQGKWLKEMGDGTLSRFKSALDAVYCAVEIQEATLEDEDIQIRIGIHLGDISFESEDVFGTGVNIASRIQGVADPGGIYVSDTIFKVIRSNPDIQCKYLGDFNLKNVKDPVSLYAIQGDNLPEPVVSSDKGLITPGPLRKRSLIVLLAVLSLIIFIGYWVKERVFDNRVKQIKSIAVMPFDNLSGDPDQEFFSDGITEALIIDLSKISALKVIARSSVMQYKESNKSLPEIARDLKVDAILEGSVFREGDIVNISAVLINPDNDQNLWADRFERNLSSILKLYSEVAQVIAHEIEISILPEEKLQFESAGLINGDSYEAYLRGKSQLYKLSLANYDSAYWFFDRSLELDSTNALAYVGMALYWVHQSQWGGVDPRFAFEQAGIALQNASRWDSSMAEIYLINAHFQTSFYWDWGKAVEEYKIAIQLNPNLPEPRLFYADLLLSLHEEEESMYQIRRALEVDPLNSFSHSIHGWALYATRQFDEAARAFNRSLELDPKNSLSLRCMWTIHSLNGDFDQAIEFGKKFYRSQGNTEVVDDLNDLYPENDYTSTLRITADRCMERREIAYMPPMRIARFYALCGEKAKAIELLEEAYEERFPSMFSLNVDPHWDPLKDQPEFESLVKKMNLTLN